MSALISYIIVPSPSSDKLSLKLFVCVSLSLLQVKKAPINRAPMIKLGWICRYDQKSLKYVDRKYINFVMKPNMPNAKCLIDVGNNYIAYIAKNVLPILTTSLTQMSNVITNTFEMPWYVFKGPMKKYSTCMTPAMMSSLLITYTLPRLRLVRMDKK